MCYCLHLLKKCEGNVYTISKAVHDIRAIDFGTDICQVEKHLANNNNNNNSYILIHNVAVHYYNKRE